MMNRSWCLCTHVLNDLKTAKWSTYREIRDRRQSRQERIREEKLSEREQEILDSIHDQLQADELRLSSRLCVECQRPFILLQAGDEEIDFCIHCSGYWFDRGELMRVVGTYQDVPSDNLKSRQSRFKCPVCGELMREYVYHRPHTLLVDQCVNGHGVYLEARELARALEID